MDTTTRITHIWPCFAFADARASIEFLTSAFGFEVTALYARDDDPAVVDHAELRWPDGGGIMCGTAGKDDSDFGRRSPGHGATYVVCSDPDSLFARATAAGASVVMVLHDTDYGSRDFTVRDPDGNLWSFGTYPGAE